jgi:hypothetical protein
LSEQPREAEKTTHKDFIMKSDDEDGVNHLISDTSIAQKHLDLSNSDQRYSSAVPQERKSKDLGAKAGQESETDAKINSVNTDIQDARY